jgi:hypothetical protein
MALTNKTVDSVNRETQGLPIAAQRLDELPVELGQFAAVMERVRRRVGFDQDPSDFVRARTPADKKIEP